MHSGLILQCANHRPAGGQAEFRPCLKYEYADYSSNLWNEWKASMVHLSRNRLIQPRTNTVNHIASLCPSRNPLYASSSLHHTREELVPRHSYGLLPRNARTASCSLHPTSLPLHALPARLQREDVTLARNTAADGVLLRNSCMVWCSVVKLRFSCVPHLGLRETTPAIVRLASEWRRAAVWGRGVYVRRRQVSIY
jgi:hypothetical protein